MARIFTEGFEMGDVKSFYALSSAANFSAKTESVRSGTYGLKIEHTESGAFYIKSSSEIYTRILTRFERDISRMRVYWRNGNSNIGFYHIAYSPGNIELYVGDSLVAETTSGAYAILDWFNIETHIKLDSVDGILAVRVNGVEVLSYSGDTIPSTDTEIDNIRLVSDYSIIHVDDIAVNDTTGTEDNSWCGDGHIILYKPNASGSTTMLMGSDEDQTDNYALVDDIPSDGDTTYVYSGSPGYYDLYKLEDTDLPVNSVIKRVWVESRAKDPDIGYLRGVIQTASGSYTSGSVQMTTEYAAQKYDEYTTNPSTGSGWTFDEIDYLQAGIQIAE